MLNDLKELLAIKSVLSDPAENAPFGKGCRQALDWFLAKASAYGLRTGELDGYCGWAEYGEGEQCIAALCHLDVVPEGEGWKSDPYSLTVEKDMLYGRGVADDKGAAIMCLHALKEIADSKVRLNKRLRLIVGLNEEHGSACMNYYAKHGEIPACSFVPDSDFPVINSEKGILHLGVKIPLDKFFKENIAFISGGGSINVVPDRAALSIFNNSPLHEYLKQIGGNTITGDIFSASQIVGGILAAGSRVSDYSVKQAADALTITAAGTAGHAMAPEKADNAVWKLFAFLSGLADNSAVCDCLNEYFCTPLSAQRLGIYKSDEESGENTINLGIIEVTDEHLYFTLDVRLCISSKNDDIKKIILSKLPPKSKIDTLRFSPNLYIDKDSDLVKTLLSVYQDMTGLEPYCIKCGGGTYAKTLPNAVAFGPNFPGVVTNLHKPDECLPLDDFYKAAKIYKETFLRLAK